MYTTQREESKTIRSAPLNWFWDSIYSLQFPFCFIDRKRAMQQQLCSLLFWRNICTMDECLIAQLCREDCNGFLLFKTVQWVYPSTYVLLYQPRQLICLCFNFSCHDTPMTLLRNGVAPSYSVLKHLMHLPWGKQWQPSAEEILCVPGAETLAHLNKWNKVLLTEKKCFEKHRLSNFPAEVSFWQGT